MEKIYSHFISRDPKDDGKRVAYLTWFCHTFPEQEFRGEDRVMREYLSYSAKLSVPLKEKYLEVFAKTELRKFLIRTSTKVPGTETLDYTEPTSLETAVQICSGTLFEAYHELENINSDIGDFKVSADAFMSGRLNERLTEVLGKTFEIVSDTDNSMSAADYALQAIQLLNEIYDKEQLEELDDNYTEDETISFVCDTGIPAIDNDITGIYETHLIGIEAQPGTGKTIFTLGVWVYRAITIYHKNVIFYTLEQSVAEMKAVLIARHVYALYNIQINADLIVKNIVPDEYKEHVASAKLDLFESGKYGKVIIEATTLYLENFIEKIKIADRLQGPFDMICIDYMGLIEQISSKDGYNGKFIYRLEDYQIIGRAFKKFKRYVRKTRKCGIAISQFNDKGIEAGKADKEITPNMAQGGIEVYRNTDANLAISMTPAMKLQNKRRMSQPKVRHSAGFGTFIMDCRPGIGLFYQIVQNKI